jgi:hypothetical protein
VYQAGAASVLTAMADDGVSVLLSSHVLADLERVADYLIQHGYTLGTTYQPVSRFWPFQRIEGGWLLVLSALLIAATVWLVRRRAA